MGKVPALWQHVFNVLKVRQHAKNVLPRREGKGEKRRPAVNPIVFAMRHPITTMMLVVTLIGGGALALNRMRIDIFPPINQPKIIVFTNYGGYDPGQMEGLLVSQFEFWFQFVDGVSHMESKSIQQV